MIDLKDCEAGICLAL